MDTATSTAAAAAAAPTETPKTDAAEKKPTAPPAEGAQPGSDAAAAKPEEPQHTLKVGGKERKVNTAELVRLAQLNENAELTTKEARELEKRAKSILEAFEKDPRGAAARALKEFGKKDLREVAIEILSEEMAAQAEEERKKALDPKELELEELRAKDKKRAEDDKTTAEKKRAEEVTRVQQGITNAVIATLEELPEGYRKNDLVAQTTLDAWAYVVENAEELQKSGADLKKITPKTVAAEVLKQIRAMAREVAQHSDDAGLEEVLSPEVKARALKLVEKKDAHPALTSTPQVRDPHKKDDAKDEPRLTSAQLVRRATLGL